MKLLANENFPLGSILYLRNSGYDILSIGSDYSGIKDLEVIKLAQKESRTILTFDRDYGELIFRHNLKPEMGVIYLRLLFFDSDEPGKIIDRLLSDNTFSPVGRLTVIDGDTIRQREY